MARLRAELMAAEEPDPAEEREVQVEGERELWLCSGCALIASRSIGGLGARPSVVSVMRDW